MTCGNRRVDTVANAAALIFVDEVDYALFALEAARRAGVDSKGLGTIVAILKEATKGVSLPLRRSP